MTFDIKDYTQETQDWYKKWINCEHKKLFTELDIQRLQMKCKIVQYYYETENPVLALALFKEIRATESQLGCTIADRLKNKISKDTKDNDPSADYLKNVADTINKKKKYKTII